jgi:catechol 2,3-dioxygenase-like lactoylglutathione lyase family enzyme
MNVPAHDVEFGRMAPTIGTADLPRALDFYVGVLGMTKTFENGKPVSFVILQRGEAELHVESSQTSARDDHSPNVVHLLVDDATKLHDHLVAHGVRIVRGLKDAEYGLRDAEYGLRDFVFADPDGNRIDVGQRLA